MSVDRTGVGGDCQRFTTSFCGASATGPKSVGLHVRSGLGADTRARARVETGARSRACMRIHDAGAVLASFGSALPFPPGGGA